METSTLLLIAVALGYVNAIFTLLGVGLGGYLVHRTKREPYETLFTKMESPGSGIAATDYEPTQSNPFIGEEEGKCVLGSEVSQYNQQFLRQYKEDHPTFVTDCEHSGEEDHE